MGKILNQMLDNYLTSSNVELQKGPDSVSFTINSAEGISRTSLYNILPYMHLIFFDIHARSLPGEIAENAEFHPLQFNYCVGGRIELLLDDNSYIYLKENVFVSASRLHRASPISLQGIIMELPCTLTRSFSPNLTGMSLNFSIWICPVCQKSILKRKKPISQKWPAE